MSATPSVHTAVSPDASARQWAWEFLRRNPGYRAAWNEVSKLSPPQQKLLEEFADSGLDRSGDLSEFSALKLTFFETDRLEGYGLNQLTVADYSRAVRANSSDVHERPVWVVANEYRLSTYGLAKWIDPAESLSRKAADAVWRLDVTCLFGLVEFADDPRDEGGATEGALDAQLAMEEFWAASLGNQPGSIGGSADTDASENEGLLGYLPDREGVEASKVVDGATESEPVAQQQIRRDARKRRRPVSASRVAPLIEGSNGAFFMGRSDHAKQALPMPLRASEVAIVLRSDFPLDEQLEIARKVLNRHRQRLAAAGLIGVQRERNSTREVFQRYVRILDLSASGMSAMQIACELQGIAVSAEAGSDGKLVNIYATRDGSAPSTTLVRKQIDRAANLRDNGFIALAFSGLTSSLTRR